jgi:hypothetical protein
VTGFKASENLMDDADVKVVTGAMKRNKNGSVISMARNRPDCQCPYARHVRGPQSRLSDSSFASVLNRLNSMTRDRRLASLVQCQHTFRPINVACTGLPVSKGNPYIILDLNLDILDQYAAKSIL